MLHSVILIRQVYKRFNVTFVTLIWKFEHCLYGNCIYVWSGEI